MTTNQLISSLSSPPHHLSADSSRHVTQVDMSACHIIKGATSPKTQNFRFHLPPPPSSLSDKKPLGAPLNVELLCIEQGCSLENGSLVIQNGFCEEEFEKNYVKVKLVEPLGCNVDLCEEGDFLWFAKDTIFKGTEFALKKPSEGEVKGEQSCVCQVGPVSSVDHKSKLSDGEEAREGLNAIEKNPWKKLFATTKSSASMEYFPPEVLENGTKIRVVPPKEVADLGVDK